MLTCHQYKKLSAFHFPFFLVLRLQMLAVLCTWGTSGDIQLPSECWWSRSRHLRQSLLQELFQTQGLNQDLPHCRRIEFFAKFGFSVVAAVLLSNQDSSLVLYLCALDKWEGNGGG